MNKTVSSVNTFSDIPSLMKKYPELEEAIRMNDITIVHGGLNIMPLKESLVEAVVEAMGIRAPSSNAVLSKLAKNNEEIQVSNNNKLKR